MEIRVGVRLINSDGGIVYGGPNGSGKFSDLAGIRFEEARRETAFTFSRELRNILRDLSFDIDFGNLICGKAGILAEIAKVQLKQH